jgi:hypothetical protein
MHLTDKDKHWLREKIGNKFFQANGSWKQAGVVIQTFDKENFKPKLVRRDKEGHSILIKGTICQDKITTVNTYMPNIGAANCIK